MIKKKKILERINKKEKKKVKKLKFNYPTLSILIGPSFSV